jgi:hypothetical protein
MQIIQAENQDHIWQQWAGGEHRFIVVPTNGIVKSNGKAVMGAGFAKRAAEEVPFLEEWLGENIKEYGNEVFINMDHEVITFPTKDHWSDLSNINLIEISTRRLHYLAHLILINGTEIYLPQVGCGLGELDWEEKVRPVLERYLRSDAFIAMV